MESLMESKLQIDLDVLHKCVKKSLKKEVITSVNWQVNPVSCRSKNFTTAGVYPSTWNCKSSGLYCTLVVDCKDYSARSKRKK